MPGGRFASASECGRAAGGVNILQVHNGYRRRGGEDAVVAAEAALLEAHGHRVDQFIVSNHDLSGMQMLAVGLRAGDNMASRRAMASRLGTSRPDVVHVHNVFPQLSTSIYQPCAERDIPVVQTLHNYRPLCPGANLTREGRPCEDCVGRLPVRAVAHRCYRGSVAASAAAALMVASNARRSVWQRSVDRFITPSAFTRDKFVSAGFPLDRIVVKPNFAGGLWSERPAVHRRSGLLFVGRLSAEKGVATLMRAAEAVRAPLRVVGEGPMSDCCRRSGFVPVGELDAGGVRREMLASTALVVPSECYEAFPLVIVEAFASGLPVVAANIGALAELVQDGRTGLLFAPGSALELSRLLDWASRHPDEMARMGALARQVYEERFTAARNYECLLSVYRAATDDPCADRARRSPVN